MENQLVVLATAATDAGRYYVQAVNEKNGENKTSPSIYLNVAGKQRSKGICCIFSHFPAALEESQTQLLAMSALLSPHCCSLVFMLLFLVHFLALSLRASLRGERVKQQRTTDGEREQISRDG